jgi:hypothetical protein
MRTTMLILVGFVLVLTVGLAQDDRGNVKQVEIDGGEPPAEKACFNVREVRNFDALDDRFVYVEGRGDERFLLTMLPGCIGLRGALGIAISNDFSRVCSLDTARITYRGLGSVETCTIHDVEAVEDKAAAEALVKARKAQ